MKILLWADKYLGLSYEIIHELERQGHDVVFLEEPKRGTSAFQRTSSLNILRFIKRLYVEQTNYFDNYWSNRIKNDKVLNVSYDVLFVINGMSFSNVLLEHLRKINPSIKASLYIWDSNLTFDYFRNVRYFDKAFSFDFYDVQKFGDHKVEFLPFFWPLSILDYDCSNLRYDIFSVGSLHDDRLFVYDKIAKQMEKENRPYYIKLYVSPQKMTFGDRIKLVLLKLTKCSKKYESKNVSLGLKKYPFVINNYIPVGTTIRQMCFSKSVLDTDLEKQSGTTPRLIWAMACNKHIFTTNKKITNLPFYDSNFIHVIDRKNPYVDTRLLNENVNSRGSIEYLRIDNWVQNFL